MHFRMCLEGNSLFCSCWSGLHAVITHLEDDLFICEAKVPPKPAFLHLTTFITAFQLQFSAAVRNSCHKLIAEVKLPGIAEKMSKQVTLKTLHKCVSAQRGDVAVAVNMSLLDHPSVEEDTLMEHRYPSS